MEVINKNRFKFVLKDKENSHYIPAQKLELVLINLRKFIDSTVERLEHNTSPPQLNVVAQPASSFGIEFELVIDGFDFDDIASSVIFSLENLLVDVEMMSENELYDLIFEEEKYSPKQIKNFASLTKTIVNSGYDFIYEYNDSATGEKRQRDLTVDNKERLVKLGNALSAGEETLENTVMIDCIIAAVNTNRNGFTIFAKKELFINKYLTIRENEVLAGLFSDSLMTELKNIRTNIPVPCHANVKLEIVTKTNYTLDNPTTSKYTIKGVEIVED